MHMKVNPAEISSPTYRKRNYRIGALPLLGFGWRSYLSCCSWSRLRQSLQSHQSGRPPNLSLNLQPPSDFGYAHPGNEPGVDEPPEA